MQGKYYNSLFLSQSYEDNYKCYVDALEKDVIPAWDYILVTASNERQAEAFRKQIAYRQKENWLCPRTKFDVIPDPDNRRVGSGGATLNVLKYIYETQQPGEDFYSKKILIIHSGGDSKRIPQYSVCGKLFSPIPHRLPNGRSAALFDEILVSVSGIPARMKEGLMTFSGDILVLFNPLQVDENFDGVAVLSAKSSVSTGKNHGVFLGDGRGNVKRFLHKISENKLKSFGAVNENGQVDIDTGAVLFDMETVRAFLSLILTDGKVDKEKFNAFVNEKVRLNFYGDFLYPMASDAVLEAYYQEPPEFVLSDELMQCRKQIWDAVHERRMKLIRLEPADFIHLGTTEEVRKLYTEEIDNYYFLGWRRAVNTTGDPKTYTAVTSYVSERAEIGKGSYLEYAYIGENARVGRNCILSNVKLENISVPDNTVLHGLKLKNGKYTVRTYDITDNPKELRPDTFSETYGVQETDLWAENEPKDLWHARLFPVCGSPEEAVRKALYLTIERKKSAENTSLYLSYINSDAEDILQWQRALRPEINYALLLRAFAEKTSFDTILKTTLGRQAYEEDFVRLLVQKAEEASFENKIRLYVFLSCICPAEEELYRTKCLRCVQETIRTHYLSKLPQRERLYFAEDTVTVKAPLRVNWGGGWSDTPPYCLENGGTVLNAAVEINGDLPVSIEIRRLDEPRILFECLDDNVKKEITSFEEIRDCENPSDMFSLHKAALMASGIIPLTGGGSLETLLKSAGGGMYLSTNVKGIPRGSGLGTSSILAGACTKALAAFLGEELTDNALFCRVLCLEQLMFTGGGWQDQVGGIVNGIKLIKTDAGMEQEIRYNRLELNSLAMQALQNRFCLIYSGQRRLARNQLRDVVIDYLSARPDTVAVLEEIQKLAVKMKTALESGDITLFGQLLDYHWKLVKRMYPGHSNQCIEEIFALCDDLIEGRMVCGAGGGGFLQVVLKEGYTKDDLAKRLETVFGNGEIGVYDSKFV